MGIADDLETELAQKRTQQLELAAEGRLLVREGHLLLNHATMDQQAEVYAALDEALDAYAMALDGLGEPWRRGTQGPPLAGAVNPLHRMLGDADEHEGKVPA